MTQYANNGLNQRVRKSGAGPIGNVSYLHDSSGLLLGETSHNGTAITTQYIWLGGELIGVIRHNVLYYAHTDQLGRPEVITDQNQTTVWRTHLFAYQSSAYFDTFGGLHIGFPGQYYDPESDLWYNWHRYYDASTGRYLQSDPIGLDGGANTYAYVEANPISYVDPTGKVIPIFLRIVGPVAISALKTLATQAIKCGTAKGAPPIKPGAANGSTAGLAFPKSVKDAAKAENPTATCVYCRREGTGTQVDHAIPRARGGDATLDNAQLACPHCNASKGARDFPKTPPSDYVGPWPPTHW